MKNRSLEHKIRDLMMETAQRNTELRRKVKNVGRPGDDPKNADTSKLAKQGEIKTKIIDEATVDVADIEKKKMISQPDKDKLSKIHDMMQKERQAKAAKKVKEDDQTDDAISRINAVADNLKQISQPKPTPSLPNVDDHNIDLLKTGVKKPTKEEVEQVDEVSKKTLQSYRSKAENEISNASKIIRGKDRMSVDPDKIAKRIRGIKLASKKLKEEVEIDEAKQKPMTLAAKRLLDLKAKIAKDKQTPVKNKDSEDHEAWREKRAAALKGRSYHEEVEIDEAVDRVQINEPEYNEKSKAHKAGRKAIDGWYNPKHAQVEYHKNGSATVHYHGFSSTLDPSHKISSVSQVDSHLQHHGLMHNYRPSKYNDMKQKDKQGLTHHVQKTKTGHIVHIHEAVNEEVEVKEGYAKGYKSPWSKIEKAKPGIGKRIDQHAKELDDLNKKYREIVDKDKKKDDVKEAVDDDTKKKKSDMDDMDAKEIKGGKTEVIMNPKTDDSPEESSQEDQKSKKATKDENKKIGTKSGVKEEVMSTKNFGLPQSLIDVVTETLKGGQKKIDKNHNGKIDGEDFKILRGEKKGMKEEVEQIDEVSKDTLQKYIRKASTDAANHAYTAGTGDVGRMKINKDEYHQKASKRLQGISKAAQKMAKEEIEQVEEEQIDEISKQLAGNYVKKAADDNNLNYSLHQHYKKSKKPEDKKFDKWLQRKHKNRSSGIDLAVNKLTGNAKVNAKEEVEQIDEKENDTYNFKPRAKAYNPKSKAHKAAHASVKNYHGDHTAHAVYHHDGKAEVHYDAGEDRDNFLKSSHLVADHMKKHGMKHDHSEKKYNDMKQKDAQGLTHHVRKLAKNYHVVHIHEEVEQIDEVSKKTVQSYYNKGREQGMAIQDRMKVGGGDWSKDGSDTKTLKKRQAGHQMALRRRRGEVKMSEEAQLSAEEIARIEEIAKGLK